MNTHPTVLDIDARSRRYTDLHQRLAAPETVRTPGHVARARTLARTLVQGVIAVRTAKRTRAGNTPVGPVKA